MRILTKPHISIFKLFFKNKKLESKLLLILKIKNRAIFDIYLNICLKRKMNMKTYILFYIKNAFTLILWSLNFNELRYGFCVWSSILYPVYGLKFTLYTWKVWYVYYFFIFHKIFRFKWDMRENLNIMTKFNKATKFPDLSQKNVDRKM